MGQIDEEKQSGVIVDIERTEIGIPPKHWLVG